MGAVLLQDQHPIAYASKSFTTSQKNHAQIEKMMLVIVFGCNKFHDYVYGLPNIVVETDHKSLESILQKPLRQHQPDYNEYYYVNSEIPNHSCLQTWEGTFYSRHSIKSTITGRGRRVGIQTSTFFTHFPSPHPSWNKSRRKQRTTLPLGICRPLC